MAYVPHVGQAVCAGRFSLHRAQVTRVGSEAFHCERRWRVLERDVLRLGTGTVLPSLVGLLLSVRVSQGRQGGPARIEHLVGVVGILLEPEPA